MKLVALAAAVVLTSAVFHGAGLAEPCRPEVASQIYPDARWSRLANGTPPGTQAGLKRIASTAEEVGLAAVIVIQHGRVLAEWGDTSTPYETRSIRKSFLNAVIGRQVAQNRLKLDATLADLGIDDTTPLTPIEKSARVVDLLTSRSGIYLDAAYEPASMERDRPPRGSHPPGTFFFYNNWDFNALGTIAERAAGQSLFKSFRDEIAAPLQMENFRLADTEYRRDGDSRHPAYLFSMSARDRARFGLLYLRKGCWRGMQIVPENWVDASLAPQVQRGPTQEDYGYLWWSQGPVKSRGMKGRMQLARGNGSQFIALIPELDLVIVTSTATNWMLARKFLGWLPPDDANSRMIYAVLDARAPAR